MDKSAEPDVTGIKKQYYELRATTLVSITIYNSGICSAAFGLLQCGALPVWWRVEPSAKIIILGRRLPSLLPLRRIRISMEVYRANTSLSPARRAALQVARVWLSATLQRRR